MQRAADPLTLIYFPIDLSKWGPEEDSGDLKKAAASHSRAAGDPRKPAQVQGTYGICICSQEDPDILIA
eukprot:CAMPEP_0113693992 /NCGR_PEP_ID=MMETSP0038_2-20120614/20003_1 /TAXON_ID=2898 /ORGANISM="Cryptomonas paramecium" /LENGTH=68 /DNA_ID=CAMNT_0000616187 /DNA_START=37 /DNA_END=241 /DNA_ORIENTATION=- /assembly_acc=CAM_ASM_000170